MATDRHGLPCTLCPSLARTCSHRRDVCLPRAAHLECVGQSAASASLAQLVRVARLDLLSRLLNAPGLPGRCNHRNPVGAETGSSKRDHLPNSG
jgi:hypothetical protein